MDSPKSLLKGFGRTVATTKPQPGKRLLLSDPDTRGLYLRVTPKGRKSYTIVSRNSSGKQVWAVVGNCDDLTVDQARRRAKEGLARIKAGEVAFAPKSTPSAPLLFASVCTNFLQRHVLKQGLLSRREIDRIFRKYVLPRWGQRDMLGIKRGDVARLLDEIEDDHGSVMADRVLATISKLFNWFATREDDYSSPVVRGMGRAPGRERTRTRILDDNEIRILWRAAETAGLMGALAITALLTAQRRGKIVSMQWAHIENGTWHIPTAPREKSTAGTLRLPPLAISVIESQPRLAGNPYVFSGRATGPIVGLSKLKLSLDEKMAAANGGQAISPWVLHDLRRTAKSLMSRAEVRPDVSERVLGHVIMGVEGVYDRHNYLEQKAAALVALAEQVKAIVNVPGEGQPLER